MPSDITIERYGLGKLAAEEVEAVLKACPWILEAGKDAIRPTVENALSYSILQTLAVVAGITRCLGKPPLRDTVIRIMTMMYPGAKDDHAILTWARNRLRSLIYRKNRLVRVSEVDDRVIITNEGYLFLKAIKGMCDLVTRKI